MDPQVLHGDCLEVMATMEENSIDSVICDPPYGLKFMGKNWDHGVPGEAYWQEALRVAKPGAILMAFGGTRTVHRLACAIEDAGWEIRDRIGWLYGSGFPKSLDISKAIDKRAGAEREDLGPHPTINGKGDHYAFCANYNGARLTAPTTPLAKEWQGYGTALKPAWEPIIVAMKPLDGTFAENAEKWGVAGLWIDGGRVEATDSYESNTVTQGVNRAQTSWEPRRERRTFEPCMLGRFPANIIHDGSEEVLEVFPNDTARFFYCAKASKAERNQGCEGMEETATPQKYGLGDSGGIRTAHKNAPAKNHHPTVKPLALMEYLCKLTRTPTGGIVLDPFCGSGTTGMAAIKTGRQFIGIEKEAEYCEIARARIASMIPPEPIQKELAI